jgi:hypothetical protein
MILSHANANNAFEELEGLVRKSCKNLFFFPPLRVWGGGAFLYRLPYLLLDGQVNYTEVLRWLF